MIDVDGGYLEGGGQILRTAVAFSAITGLPVRIFDIRKGRDKTGLRPQHLHGINAAGQICSARIDGLEMNSTELTFIPRKITGGRYVVDTKTAGSVTLILQTLVPIGLCADLPLELTVKGGTAVPFSPTIGYFSHVFCSILRMFGVTVEIDVKRHGFYPQGGGEVVARIRPSHLRPLNLLDRGAFGKLEVRMVSSLHLKKAKVAERMLTGFSRVIEDADAFCSYIDAPSPGCYITACAPFENGILGSSALGRRGKPAEDIGLEAANELRTAIDSSAAVDKWMVDQMIPFMALATHRTGEPSEVRVLSLTRHAQTNIWVVEKFLDVAFNMEEGVLRCTKTA